MRFIPIISKSQNITNICYDKVVNLTLYKKIHILIAYQGVISIPHNIVVK